MKKFILLFIFIVVIGFVSFNFTNISSFIKNLIQNQPRLIVKPSNEWTKNYNFKYIKISKDYIPHSYNDLVNIVYTTINNGWDSFTFYCPSNYQECIPELAKISNDEKLLTAINNFASPFNSFNNISIIYTESGEITLNINKIYSKEDIKKINKEIDLLSQKIYIGKDLDTEEKIIAIHDYIINTTKYDVERNNTGESRYASNTAMGLLFQHYAICSGYSDVMAIFLDRLHVKNYKVTSPTHVWNAVFLNNEWLHLDLTWDDPVSSDGRDTLWHKFMLINTETLKKLDNTGGKDHLFNSQIYLEFAK